MPADRFDAIPDVYPVLSAGDLLLREVESGDAPAWFRRFSDPLGALPQGSEVVERLDEAADAIASIRGLFHDKRILRWEKQPPPARLGSTTSMYLTGVPRLDMASTAHGGIAGS